MFILPQNFIDIAGSVNLLIHVLEATIGPSKLPAASLLSCAPFGNPRNSSVMITVFPNLGSLEKCASTYVYAKLQNVPNYMRFTAVSS